MTNLQSDIDKYINKQKKEDIKLTDDDDNYDLKFLYTDENEYIVDIYKNKKILIRATYEILGCYNIISSTWTWSYAISQMERDLSNNVEDQINKFKDLLLTGKITKETEEYLYYLSNPSFFISYKSLNKLLNFGLYITKSKHVVAHKINKSQPKIIEFILIKKILQQHQS